MIIATPSPRQSIRNFSAWLLFGIILLAVISEPLLRHWFGADEESVSLLDRFAPASAQHWLGTDELGRDELLRLLAGGRISLTVGLLGAGLATLIGTIIGVFAGTRGGRWDAALMRVTDGVMTLPLLPLLIVLAAVDLTNSDLPRSWPKARP